MPCLPRNAWWLLQSPTEGPREVNVRWNRLGEDYRSQLLRRHPGGRCLSTASPGNDELRGDTGADNLFGEAGDDQLFGGADNDGPLVGGDGSDTINGDDGDDSLTGDRIFGGGTPGTTSSWAV